MRALEDVLFQLIIDVNQKNGWDHDCPDRLVPIAKRRDFYALKRCIQSFASQGHGFCKALFLAFCLRRDRLLNQDDAGIAAWHACLKIYQNTWMDVSRWAKWSDIDAINNLLFRGYLSALAELPACYAVADLPGSAEQLLARCDNAEQRLVRLRFTHLDERAQRVLIEMASHGSVGASACLRARAAELGTPALSFVFPLSEGGDVNRKVLIDLCVKQGSMAAKQLLQSDANPTVDSLVACCDRNDSDAQRQLGWRLVELTGCDAMERPAVKAFGRAARLGCLVSKQQLMDGFYHRVNHCAALIRQNDHNAYEALFDLAHEFYARDLIKAKLSELNRDGYVKFHHYHYYHHRKPPYLRFFSLLYTVDLSTFLSYLEPSYLLRYAMLDCGAALTVSGSEGKWTKPGIGRLVVLQVFTQYLQAYASCQKKQIWHHIAQQYREQFRWVNARPEDRQLWLAAWTSKADNNEVISLPIIWRCKVSSNARAREGKSHIIKLMLFKLGAHAYLALSNRGDGADFFSGVRFFLITKHQALMREDWLSPLFDPHKARELCCDVSLAQGLGKQLGLEQVAAHRQKLQKIGNCAVLAQYGDVLVRLFIDYWRKQPDLLSRGFLHQGAVDAVRSVVQERHYKPFRLGGFKRSWRLGMSTIAHEDVPTIVACRFKYRLFGRMSQKVQKKPELTQLYAGQPVLATKL